MRSRQVDAILEVVLDQVIWCWLCGGDRTFEAPGCAECAEGECPERLCVECGAAVLVALPAGQVRVSA